jgi:hypothetical protein
MGILVYLRMDVLNAFLVATAGCYLVAIVFVLFDKPPLVRVGKKPQILMYFLSFGLILLVAMGHTMSLLNFLLGLYYCFATVGSYIGWPQVWGAYWTDNPRGGSATGQIIMAMWNLVLSVIFFMLC